VKYGIGLKEQNQCVKEKTGAQNIVKEIKQYQKQWLQHVCTEDGHKQNNNTSTAIQTERKKEHRATEEEMEGGTNFIWRIKEQAKTPKPSRT
jgi:hypothetical protein